MGAHLEAAERQPLLTPEDGVNANSFDPQSAEPKPHSKLNFVSKHWRGEYSLPRSFWLHGVLLGYLLLVVSCLVGEETGLYPGRIFYCYCCLADPWSLAFRQPTRGVLGKDG